MNEQNEIKEAINEIPVPSKELDIILSNAFKNKKKKLKFSLSKTVKYIALAGILSLCIVSSAFVSPAVANFVAQIPIIGQAFDYFILQEDYYQAYEEISTDIGLVEKSRGIEINIQKAFYDGNTVTLSYIIRAEENLNLFQGFKNFPNDIRQGGFKGEYVDDVGYVGMMTLTMRDKTKDKVNIDWTPRAILLEDQTIEGDWHFEFSLNKLVGEHIEINKQVSQDGVSIELIDAIKTDVNLTINYVQDVAPSVQARWLAVEAELSAIDNLGNHYEVPYNGGTGTKGGDSSEDITWNATIHGLAPDASSITFYPFAHVSNSQSDYMRIDFKPITVELN